MKHFLVLYCPLCYIIEWLYPVYTTKPSKISWVLMGRCDTVPVTWDLICTQGILLTLRWDLISFNDLRNTIVRFIILAQKFSSYNLFITLAFSFVLKRGGKVILYSLCREFSWGHLSFIKFLWHSSKGNFTWYTSVIIYPMYPLNLLMKIMSNRPAMYVTQWLWIWRRLWIWMTCGHFY